MSKILVTGAAGFIGSNFVEYYIQAHPEDSIVVLDKLTYAGNIHNLDKSMEIAKDRVKFVQGDICDVDLVTKIFNEEGIDSVIHFAAESHVDNSIKTPFVFTTTNVLGTHTLLEVARRVWGEGSPNKFVHISTDEVFGTLKDLPTELAEKIAKDPAGTLAEMSQDERKEYYFTEINNIRPNSPYSASKASSDMIARAYFETFKMNVNVTNCSNNYGPYQHMEKLIPNTIKKALQGEKIPVYGDGRNIRDWLYVEDHCHAIDLVFHNAKAGERYNIGGHNERRNIKIVELILKHLAEVGKLEDTSVTSFNEVNGDTVAGPFKQIEYVTDRKGHDFRYAIDPTKITNELGWAPETKFEDGIIKTIDWYLENLEWLEIK